MRMNDGFWESWNQLRRRRVCLAEVQFILDREIGTFESGLFYPSLVLRDLKNDNEAEMQKVEQEFYDGVPDHQSKVLLDRYSSLKERHKSLMETEDWIVHFRY
jgi:hypothetical protein